MAARSIRVLLTLALLFGGIAWALPKEKEKWIRVETENFTLLSNAGESRSRQVVQNLEVLRDVLSRITKGLEFNSPLPTKIYGFKSTSSFNRYNIYQNGKPANISGFFVKSADGNYVALDTSAGAEPFRVIYHEYLHYFLANNFPDLPLWLNEGLAEFYSTFEWKGAKAELGHPIEQHIHWLQSNELTPLPRLFATETDSPDYNESDRQGMFYAQSWALTHYLLMIDNGTSVSKLAIALNHGEEPTQAIEQILGKKLPEIEAELRRHSNKERFSYFTFKFDDALSQREAKVIPVERAELLFELGDLLVHTPPLRADVAEDHLRAGLKIDPESSDCYAALGTMRQIQDQPDQAAEFYRKAIELDSGNAWAYKTYGSLIVARWYENPDKSTDGTPPEFLEARQLFRKSLKLSPDDPESLAGLGQTFIHEKGDTSEGIDAMTRAARALPSRTDVLFNLLVLQVNAGNEEVAKQIVEQALRPRADRKTLNAAEDMLLQFDVARAQELLGEGKLNEASDVLQTVADNLHDPAYKQTILSRIMSLRGDAASRNDLELYNRAIKVSNGGDIETALGLLRQVIAEAGDPSLKQMAESAIDSMERNRVIAKFNEGIGAANAGHTEEAMRLLEEALALGPDDAMRERIEEIISKLAPPKKRGRR